VSETNVSGPGRRKDHAIRAAEGAPVGAAAQIDKAILVAASEWGATVDKRPPLQGRNGS
jgi:hypothetical protein